MTTTEDYIYHFDSSQRAVMLFIHNLLCDDLRLTDKLKYGIPFYYKKSWICYLKSGRNNSVEFAFVRGNELSNAQRLLDSKGRKQEYRVGYCI